MKWTCTICGKTAAWGPTWCWYGALLNRETGAEPDIIAVMCGTACKKKYGKRGLWAIWVRK